MGNKEFELSLKHKHYGVTTHLGIVQEFYDRKNDREKWYPVLEICTKCLEECKQHGAKNLLSFICYKFKGEK